MMNGNANNFYARKNMLLVCFLHHGDLQFEKTLRKQCDMFTH